MIVRRRVIDRLAGALSRRPMRIALGALLLCAVTVTGLFRFSVDAGQSLLVGSSSDAGTTYAKFSSTFGSDPIVLVFAAQNPTAPYIEKNLIRLGALELDLAYDKRVASVLGPGTIAGSLSVAALTEVTKVVAEYPYFVAETDYLNQIAMGNTNATQLATRLQNDISNATALLELYVIKAASDAHNTRAQYTQQTTDRVIDSRERAVDAAVAKDPLPPLWAQYIAGPGHATNQTIAQQVFDRVTAAYGDCDSQIASFLKIASSCQVFFERTLLDLPTCPTVTNRQFCAPKPQWAAVLPQPAVGGQSYEIVTIRVKPEYVGDSTAMQSLVDKIDTDLSAGVAVDSYSTLSTNRRNTLKVIGALAPTECGGQTQQQDPACFSAFRDRPLLDTIAGAPLLGHGVVSAMTSLLLILFPVAMLVMLLLLVGVFRVRGRVWPLLAAVAATVATVGISLLTGTPITPAVLAGVPVLLGLGVDYAVQLVARYSEERDAGAPEHHALHTALANTGRATLIAALATLVGLVALVVFSGIDWGPLVAVPLVAEFALVLCGGVVLAWLSAVFIALPLAVWSGRRSEQHAQPVREKLEVTRPALRTVAIADNWMGVVTPLAILAFFGWILLHWTPVQTDVQQLLAQSLPQLHDIETVQTETGFTNEIDVFLQGQVVTGGLDAQNGTPTSVEWQCRVALDIRTIHASQVAEATSIGDFFIASSSSSNATSSPSCVSTTGGATPSPAPSPGASPSPSPSTSPTALHSRDGAIPVSRAVAADAASSTPSAAPSSTASATPSTAATPSSSANPSAVPSPAPGQSAGGKIDQTTFLCELRLFPLLSRTLVMPIAPDVSACPSVDEYQQKFFSADPGPIDPGSARIALGVAAPSVADQAALVDSLRGELAHPPGGITATPTGLAVLATTSYDNLVNRAYLLNLAPMVVVALALLAIYRRPRRALLPLLPTVLAAGWAPLILWVLGRLPGGAGATLGALNPLTVVLGALVIALGTEFGVVLLNRFYEERGRGLDPDAAAAASLAGVGRAIRVSALTLGAGFGVLALSGTLPNSLPLIADFGLAVVIDLGLAVGAIFLVMLPVAVALERRSPLALEVTQDVAPQPLPSWTAVDAEPTAKPRPAKRRKAPPVAQPEPEPEASAADSEPARKRVPGISGRRRSPHVEEERPAPDPAAPPKRRPGVSGRRPNRKRRPSGGR